MSKVKFKHPLGVKAKCKVTGFSGTLASRLQMINGCIQYSIQPSMRTDKKDPSPFLPDAYSIDEQNIETEMTGLTPETVEFAHETGDKVKHRINGFEGHITHRMQDMNGCERYVIEGPMRKGKEVTIQAFRQELQLIDRGLNAVTEEPVKRARTGGPSTRIPAQKSL